MWLYWFKIIPSLRSSLPALCCKLLILQCFCEHFPTHIRQKNRQVSSHDFWSCLNYSCKFCLKLTWGGLTWTVSSEYMRAVTSFGSSFLKLAVISTLTNKLKSCLNKELRKGEVRKQLVKENLSSGFSKLTLLWIESDQSLHYLSIPFSCIIMQPSWLKQRRLSLFCKCLTATQSLKIITWFRFAALIPSI